MRTKAEADRETLHTAWAQVIANAPTGGTRGERQAYGNGARDTLDEVADLMELDRTEDPWDRWLAEDDEEPRYAYVILHRRGVAGRDYDFVTLELETTHAGTMPRRYVVRYYSLNGQRELWSINVGTESTLAAALIMWRDEELGV